MSDSSDSEADRLRGRQAMQRAADGDKDADRDLMAAVYNDLRRVAGRMLGQERRGHTLQPTALVHEAWLRLADDVAMADPNGVERQRFVSYAAQAMRCILIDHARSRLRVKRGGELSRQPLDELKLVCFEDPARMIDLDSALTQLASFKPRAAKIAELRIYAGLSTDEAGRIVNVSLATAKAEWALARAFLSSRMDSES